MINNILLVLIGIAGGIAVGSGVIAFITAIGVVPRVIQFTKTRRYQRYYEYLVTSGAVFSTLSLFFNIGFGYGKFAVIFVGFFMGIFIGMLAAALTEVINVIPIFARRLVLTQYIVIILILIAIGKTIGSAFYWWYPMIWN